MLLSGRFKLVLRSSPSEFPNTDTQPQRPVFEQSAPALSRLGRRGGRRGTSQVRLQHQAISTKPSTLPPFAFFDALQLHLQNLGLVNVPYQLCLILPYLLSILALMKLYRRGERWGSDSMTTSYLKLDDSIQIRTRSHFN
jgi:hypothetical protein